MAECSYARCMQKRRYIKRELMKWTKDMVYIVGLERVAEELMGRRKWKLYQEELARSQLNVNATNLVQNNSEDTSSRVDCYETQGKLKLVSPNQVRTLTENHLNEDEVVTIKKDTNENTDEKGSAVSEQGTLADREPAGLKSNLASSITRSQKRGGDCESEVPFAIDWKPDDKCYFCIDGKLLTVNEKGDLVAESGPAPSEAELGLRQTSLDSDSDSSESSPELEVQSRGGTSARKSATSLFRNSHPPNMTSLESVAARLFAAAQLQRMQPDLSHIYPGHWYQLAQQLQQTAPSTTSEINIAALSPSHKDSPSPSDITGEQPLDLSAKPSPNSLAGCNDPKQAFRAKPRVSAVTGRRTYSEEELNSALSDIMSGKLGTRRAAVQYGIPRSTLRNKVYKIAMEQKREPSSCHPPTMLQALVDQDDDKDSGDDDKDEKLLGLAFDDHIDDLVGLSAARLNSAASMQNMRKSCEGSQGEMKPSECMLETLPKRPQSVSSQPQTPPAMAQHPWLDPHLILQTLLLSGGLSGLSALMQPKHDEQANIIPEIIKRFILQQQELISKQLKTSTPMANDILNNGKPSMVDPAILMQNFGMGASPATMQPQAHASHQYASRVRKSMTPDVPLSSTDMGESSDDPSVILKIPSYKPVAGSSSLAPSGKNGEGLNSPIPQPTPPMMSRSPQQPNNLHGISPPLARHNNDSQSPPAIGKRMLSFRDLIAKSISRTITQEAAKEAPHSMGKQAHHSENHEHYKRPSISVVKSLGSSEFATAPNLLSNNSNSSNSSQNQNNSNASGKGTRPKRGKYRNYDRDSLVEAVRAVQRGEMSVHRAGSYYGVPHSTLEYKVKERHLMRPRKREPKPQPLDDRSGAGTASNSANSKTANIPGIAGSTDKTKSPAIPQSKAALKNNQPFPSTSPNGMKVPIFDSAMASAQLPYPNLFWASHAHGFGAMPLDFARTAGCHQNSPAGFPGNPESFLTSSVIQQFQEESNRHSASSAGSVVTAPTTPTTPNSVSAAATGVANNSKATRNSITAASSGVREIADNRYDTVGANGSFLDGIIRQSLERNTNDIPHGVLLDQLVKNTRLLAGNSCSNDSSPSGSKTSSKRPMSPMLFPAVDIKRERSSPAPQMGNSVSDAEISSRERDISQESVEALLKMRDGLSLKMDDKLQHQQQSLLHHHQSLQQHHVPPSPQTHNQPFQLQQPQTSSPASRHIAIEDVNGNGTGNGGGNGASTGAGAHQKLDKIGQIKTEAEDSL